MMGMTLGLDKPGQCTQANLAKAVSLVPKALEPYVVDILNGVGRGGEDVSATNGGTPNANTGMRRRERCCCCWTDSRRRAVGPTDGQTDTDVQSDGQTPTCSRTDTDADVQSGGQTDPIA